MTVNLHNLHWAILFAAAAAGCITSSPVDDPETASVTGSALCPVGDDCQTLPLRKYGEAWLDANYPSAERGQPWDCSAVPEASSCSMHVRVDFAGQLFECVETHVAGFPPYFYCYLGSDLAPNPARAAPTGDYCQEGDSECGGGGGGGGAHPESNPEAESTLEQQAWGQGADTVEKPGCLASTYSEGQYTCTTNFTVPFLGRYGITCIIACSRDADYHETCVIQSCEPVVKGGYRDLWNQQQRSP